METARQGLRVTINGACWSEVDPRRGFQDHVCEVFGGMMEKVASGKGSNGSKELTLEDLLAFSASIQRPRESVMESVCR